MRKKRLINVEDCAKQEETGVAHYVFATDEITMKMIARNVNYGRESKEQYRRRLCCSGKGTEIRKLINAITM